MNLNVAVIGASGYAGAQLTALLSGHPAVKTLRLAVQSKPGAAISELFPGFIGGLETLTVTVEEILADLEQTDVLFLALPHGISMKLLSGTVLPETLKIIDLGADFRLSDPAAFEAWYDQPHVMQEHLKEWVYGLPELNRDAIRISRYIANPGCYPTASLIALMPALIHGLIEPASIIIDAKSGITGAGRGLSLNTHYCESADSLKAYSVAGHRHTAEIEETVGKLCGMTVPLSFTPHLIPMKRGILSTVYGTLKTTLSTEAVLNLYRTHYAAEPFVRVRSELPETRWVNQSNFCDVSVRVDTRTGRLIMIGVIDNLMKGAASQAVQNMNILTGCDERLGLPSLPMIP